MKLPISCRVPTINQPCAVGLFPSVPMPQVHAHAKSHRHRDVQAGGPGGLALPSSSNSPDEASVPQLQESCEARAKAAAACDHRGMQRSALRTAHSAALDSYRGARRWHSDGKAQWCRTGDSTIRCQHGTASVHSPAAASLLAILLSTLRATTWPSTGGAGFACFACGHLTAVS